ncbi:MAG: L,D-transpeptidase [Acidimicrobiales bacterium]
MTGGSLLGVVVLAVVVIAGLGFGTGTGAGHRSGSSDPAAPASGGGGSAGGGAKPAPSSTTTSSTTTLPPKPITVASVTPTAGTTGVTGTTAITVKFSEPVASSTPMPTISPKVQGTWTRKDPTTLSFTPAGAFLPDAKVTVTVPGGSGGILASDGAKLAQPVVDHFQVGHGSVLRMEELLSLLQYSPLSWAPKGQPLSPTDMAAQRKALFQVPVGTFAWRNAGWPASLTSLWHPTTYNVMAQGLVMSFQADQRQIVDGKVDARMWPILIDAWAHHQVNTGGYNYGYTSLKTQHFTVWHDGKVVFDSPANTGIPQSPTQPGTWPVFAKYPSTTMSGTNPNGSHYNDAGVPWVSYFHGGDAVHGFKRSSYGTPQSLGCVELPIAKAQQVYPFLAYGTLITVGTT